MGKTRLFLKEIRSVGLVDAGACTEADVLFYKRAEPGQRQATRTAKGADVDVNKRDVAAAVAVVKTAFPKAPLIACTMEQLLTKYADEAETFDEVRAEDRLRNELWKLTDALNYSIQSIMNDKEVTDKQSLLTQTFMQFLVALSNLSPATDGTLEKLGAKVSAARAAKLLATLEALKAAIGPLEAVMEEAMATKDKTEKTATFDREKLDPAVKAHLDAVEAEREALKAENADLKKAAKPAEPTDDPLAKADPAVKAILKKQEDEISELRKAREEDQKVAKAERDQRLEAEAVTKARTEYPRFGAAEKVGPIMKKARAGEALSTEDCDELERCMKAASEQLKDSKLLKAQGRGEGQDSGAEPKTAAEEAQKRATELVQKDSKLTMADALSQVFRDDPALHKRHRQEATQRGSSGDQE